VEQLPPTGATLSIGALRVQGSLASPARVLALVPA
jgi:kynurenine formamidase